jgi:hypothetical protein
LVKYLHSKGNGSILTSSLKDMASNPGPADASNTAVRYLLRKAGSFHLQGMYNHKSSWGKDAWSGIVTDTFSSECAFCGVKAAYYEGKFELEHLEGLNKTELGLHHPGNTVPVCKACNKRTRVDGRFANWEEHLRKVCSDRGEDDKFEDRHNRIWKHMNEGTWKLPMRSDEAKNGLRRTAKYLYEDISNAAKTAVERYEDLKREFES